MMSGNGQTTGTSTVGVIDAAKAEGRAALIGYLPVGYPTVEGSIDAARAMIDGGCDIIELGIPYTDPVMDGPVIQQAVVESLAHGTRLADTFRAVEALSATGAPILVMTYYNPVFHRGVARFAADLACAGGSGLITPDLIPDEAEEWFAASDEHGLDRVFLVAPTSTPERLALTAKACRGFTYATSTMGVTGERSSLSNQAAALVARTREAGAERVCVGVGVSTPDQAKQVASFADGVIVGSAFVRTLIEHDDDLPAANAALRTLSASLARAVRAQ